MAGCSAYPDRYQRHVQAGFAVWPDNWSGPPPRGRRSFNVSNVEDNYYTPAELAYATHWALAYSDRYVWVWTESINWWPGWVWVYTAAGGRDEYPIPPGYIEALELARRDKVPVPPVRSLDKVSPFPPSRARDQRGWSDDDTFGPLWTEYEPVCDVPPRWRFRLDPDDVGVREGWHHRDFDHRNWAIIRSREFWEPQGYDGYDGPAWYRTWFRPGKLPAGRRLYLPFGAVDEVAWVYVDGRLVCVHDVGMQGWTERFLVDVTGLLHEGQNTLIAVRVLDTIGAGGIWKSVKLVTPK